MKKLAFLILVLLLAWNLAPILSTIAILGILPFAWIAKFLAPENITGQESEFYIQFVLSGLLLWFLLGPLTRLFFGFLVPQTRRFTESKLMRRSQWIGSYLAFVGVIFPILTAIYMWLPFSHSAIAEHMMRDFGIAVGEKKLFSEATYSREEVEEDIEKLAEGLSEDLVPWNWEIYGIGLLEIFKHTALASWKLLLGLSLFVGLAWFSDGDKAPIAALYRKLLFMLDLGRMGYGGSSRFAGQIEEWGHDFDTTPGSLFLGRSLYNPLLDVGIKDDRHMLTIAGSRAGKGSSVIIPNLLLWRGSCLVIDPKGTNARVTARKRREMGQQVHIIDPFGIVTDESARFNPMGEVDPAADTFREDVNVIADALILNEGGKGGEHWSQGAKTVISGLIAHYLTTPGHGNPSLPMIREAFGMSPKQEATLWDDMLHNESPDRMAKEAAGRILRGIETDEITNIISNANAQTEWLSGLAMRRVLTADPTFRFQEIKEKPTTIYLVLPPEYLKEHNRFARLFLNLALNRIYKGGRSKTPVLMLIDEFLSLGRMAEIENAFSLVAGYNLVLWPFVQELKTMRKLYGSGADAFLTNSRAVQVFGVADSETLQFVTDKIGKRALTGVLNVTGSTNSVDLRAPAEIERDLKVAEARQYVLRTGENPLLLERVPYFRSNRIGLKDGKLPFPISRFDKQYDPDPDF